MATNCPQQLNPRAWRSARCSATACSNSWRENNCNIWLKMLDTRITAVVALPTDSRLATQTVAEFYPRRSKPNLDKSDSRYSRPQDSITSLEPPRLQTVDCSKRSLACLTPHRGCRLRAVKSAETLSSTFRALP